MGFYQLISSELTISNEARKFCSVGSDDVNVFNKLSKSSIFSRILEQWAPKNEPFSENPFNWAIPFSNHNENIVLSFGYKSTESRAMLRLFKVAYGSK